MKSNTSKVKDLLAKWQEWSQSADRSEDGWQACFPDWIPLMAAAATLMTQRITTDEELQLVETCWQMSEEDEYLADYAKANFALCRATVIRLITSRFPEVRWQVYEVLGEGGDGAERWLRHALDDEDSYCRRRAILSLAKILPGDADKIAARFINDPDPYIRQVVSDLTRS